MLRKFLYKLPLYARYRRWSRMHDIGFARLENEHFGNGKFSKRAIFDKYDIANARGNVNLKAGRYNSMSHDDIQKLFPPEDVAEFQKGGLLYLEPEKRR